MKARRAAGRQIRRPRGLRRETKRLSEAGEPTLPRKTSKERGGARTKTDTGGRVEHTEAIGRTMVKELGKPTP